MYTAVFKKSTLDQIFDSIFRELIDQDLELLNDPTLQDAVKSHIFQAIESQHLPLSALKDRDFTKGLILSFITSHLLDKYHSPLINMDALFFSREQRENDPELYQQKLEEFCRELLIARNNKLTPDKKLKIDEINMLVKELTVNNDMRYVSPMLVLKLTLNALMKEEEKRRIKIKKSARR